MSDAGLKDSPQTLLNELAARLEKQLALVADNDFQGLSERMSECDTLLSRLSGSGGISPANAESIRRIRSLYRHLGLLLAQKRDELAGGLRHGRQGRRTLRAYRRAQF